MQRKATKTTRGTNASEKRFMAWVKDQPCCICGAPGPSIADHLYGSTFKHNKILVGHWALLPYCQEHDQVKTIHGRAEHNKQFGPQSELFSSMIYSACPTDLAPPTDVRDSIEDWGR